MGLMNIFRRLGGKKHDPHTELQNMRGYDEFKNYQQERKNSENSIDPNR